MAFGEPRNLEKRRIVLTGASRGIGRVSALRLAKAGAKILAVSRDADDLARLAFDSKGYVGQIFSAQLRRDESRRSRSAQ